MADISAQPIPDFGSLMSSYGQGQANIGLTQAQAGLTGANTQLAKAQTGLVGLQSQKAQFEIGMIQKAMAAMDNLSNTQDNKSGEQSNIANPTETGIASSLNSKFYTDPMGPPGLQQYINGVAWINPAEAQRVEEQRKLMVASQTTHNQNEANDIFQTSAALADSKAPLQSLLSLRPGSYMNNLGQAINKMEDKTPQEKDEIAGNAISAAAKYSHQYTGREVTPAGDQFIDKTTGFPVVAPKIGPTAGEKINAGEWFNTPQKAIIDGREALVKPKDLGITSYQDLLNSRSVKFSSAPPGAPGTTQGNTTPANQNKALQGAGYTKDQADFIQSQPEAFPKIKGNEQLNPVDVKQREIYLEQRKAAAQTYSLMATKSQGSLTNINRINQLLNAPGLTLGPGSREYSQLETTLNQWFGSPTGQAPAYQVLNKVLNADQMHDLLGKFHEEGAQVRLGAYESRLIMEQLAANPQMTKEAIQQMLTWQASDAKYDLTKAQTAKAVIGSNRSVENFENTYAEKFPKQNIVDTTLNSFRSPKVNNYNYAQFQGKSFTTAQAMEAAKHYGIPDITFVKSLRDAGATVQ